MYNAPSFRTGSATLDATASSMTGSAAVFIAPNPAAPTNLTAVQEAPGVAHQAVLAEFEQPQPGFGVARHVPI
jgi:hypothetical protein